MKRKLGAFLAVLILALAFCLPGMAVATVLNFDDLVVPDLTVQGQLAPKLTDYSTNYGGFTWTSTATNGYWGVESSNSYKLYGNTTTLTTGAALFPSMKNVLINEDGNIGARQVAMSNSLINFQGAYFGAWTQSDNSLFYGASAITINGYLGGLGGSLVGTQTFGVSAGPLSWVAVGGTLINATVDTLEFVPADGSGGYYFLMDNFTYTAVPLPPSVLLLGIGLVGWKRKRQPVA